MNDKLEQLQKYLEKMEQFNHVNTLLYWDMRTNTPKEGFAGHSDALTYFSTEQFSMSTSDELKTLLDTLAEPEEFEKLDDKWKFVVNKMKTDMDRNRRIPKEFYESFVKAQSESEDAWEEAKEKADFSIFAPHLQKMIDMTAEMTGYTDPEKEVYDALLDQYEKGMDSATMDRLFEDLKAELIPLVQKVLAAKQTDDSKFHASFDKNAQKEVEKLLLSYIGFDWNRGTTGESTHPFTLNFSSKDVRVTNHFYEHDPLSAMYSAIHEGGHAIFEQNVNPDYDGTVAGSCSYMGIHESQSRFYENILGRNKNFWIPVYAKVQEKMPQLQDVSLDEFYKEHGYIPALKPGEKETVADGSPWEKRQPVAVTLGTAYDEWCLSQIAAELGKKEDAEYFLARSYNYRNLFNPETRFFHPKDKDGKFIEGVDYRYSGGLGARDYYDENNGYIYRWDVQHNIGDLVSLIGGNEVFTAALDSMFDTPLGMSKWQFYSFLPDHTGNVGMFSMANEPSLHIPYLYNYAGQPWKTQKRIRVLLDQWFRNDLMGVPGDEDGGGMSAFVVFSMMGFYPVTPGSPTYNIGSPVFSDVKIDLGGGNVFEIVADGASHDNKYVQSATLNGEELSGPWFDHSRITAGGVLSLKMGPKANKKWGIGNPPPSVGPMQK